MNIHILEVAFNYNQNTDVIYPVLLQDQEHTILIDCGYEGFMPLIEKAVKGKGASLENLTEIIITHHDIDHMGGLYEIKVKYPHVKVYASKIEEAYINGTEKPLRLIQAEELFSLLPDEHKPGALNFQEFLKTVRPVEVDFVLEAERLPFNDRILIINTPGHTPGHISLYLEENKTLIAADALVYENNELEIANPQFCPDLQQAVESIKKFLLLDIERIICYHGGVVDDNIQNKLNHLIARYNGS